MEAPVNMVMLTVTVSITLGDKTLMYTSAMTAQTHKLPEISAAFDMLWEKTKREATTVCPS